MILLIKKLICISLCVTGVFLLSCCSLNGKQQQDKLPAPAAEGGFTVSVLNIGKADAIILKTQNHTVLIDTGNRGDGKKILEHLEENGTESVDYLFITHFDEDHVGGAVKLLNNLSIGEVVAPKYKGSSGEYQRYIKALSELGKKQHILTQKMSFILDDVLFEAYPPLKNSYSEADNDFSIVISVTHGDNTFLFAGDAEAERLTELPKQIENMQHTFLKVPHHGKLENNTEEIFALINPEAAVITCSEEDMCDSEVITLLQNLGAEVYLTKDGQVDIESDGKDLKTIQKN